MGEGARTAVVIAVAAVTMVGCASAPSPRVPPGGISVGYARSRSSRRWHAVYAKDGQRIDPIVLPETMADNEEALSLALASEREDQVAGVAALVGWPLLVVATPVGELATTNDGRTVHEAVPLITAGVGLAAVAVAAVVGKMSSNDLRRALQVFNESRPPPPPAELDASPSTDDGPICPIGADC